jgi:5-methylcytosine-specific restriction enzyme subunit McrC
MPSMPTTLTLTEYEPLRLDANVLSTAVLEQLWRDYDQHGRQLEVTFPSPKTDHQWQLTALGWVGLIPLGRQDVLDIRPKTPLTNLFRLWETAYGLQDAHLLDGLVAAASLHDFYQHLAHTLARRALRRAQQGLYRAYLTETRPLPAIRGQITHYPQPPQVQPTCRYQESTTDLPDNQIVAYTLAHIARSGLCAGMAQTAVRRAAHVWQSAVTPTPITPADCVGRPYTRLNQDYAPLHALCRFFLEHGGPAHQPGDHAMRPFLINMARLYERFVAAWLAAHLPPPWRMRAQETIHVGARNELQFTLDLVLYAGDGRAHTILDTKYKTPDAASTTDVSQVVTYAQAKGCREAVLVYPEPLARPLDLHVGDVHVRSLTFAPENETAGGEFLTALLG